MKPILSILVTILSICFTHGQSVSDFIHIDQFGYRNNDEKIAVISDPKTGFNSGMSFTPGANYEVRTAVGNNTVFSGGITAWNGGATDSQSGDKAWYFDFSTLTTSGDYYIYDVSNNVKSYDFTIAEDVYVAVLRQAMRAFYYQRCGIAKSIPYANSNWTDGSCHLGSGQDLDCRLVTDPNNASTSRDLSGGWHDAGDFNKYVNYTFNPVHDLLSAYEENPAVWTDDFDIPESGNGIPDILDEVKWELDWLLKMQLADGSCLMKVSVTNYQVSSPPSTDGAIRYYGEAQSSATRTICSIFAHAAIVFQSVGMTTYASLLQTKATLAWSWLQNNPGHSAYSNTGFSSSNPEISAYEQDATSFVAAVYLFALTGQATYKTYVDNNYMDIHAIAWTFWYPFEAVFQDALLYYAGLGAASSGVRTAIINNFRSSVTSNNGELLPAYLTYSSPYRAFISTDNYVWGSNKVKSNTSSIFYNMIIYQADSGNDETYQKAAEHYVHYLHGVNALNLVYLSNMNAFGAEKSCDEIYHGWFDDGTDYDNASSSLFGPAPGFVPGGPNKDFSPAAAYTIAPPENQPPMKSYKDWNTTYPENSWEITEPADGYQAAYLKMLSKFAVPSSPLAVEISTPLSAKLMLNKQVKLSWQTATEVNNKGFEIERSKDGYSFAKLGYIPAQNTSSGGHYYEVIDEKPMPENYYRYKQIDIDGSITFSSIIHISIVGNRFRLLSNPITNGTLNCELNLSKSTPAHLVIYDLNGRLLQSDDLGYLTAGNHPISIKLSIPAGAYIAGLQLGEGVSEYQKIIIH